MPNGREVWVAEHRYTDAALIFLVQLFQLDHSVVKILDPIVCAQSRIKKRDMYPCSYCA